MAWILILTLAGPWHDSGTAMLQVRGFASQAQCLAAGDAWIAQMRKAGNHNPRNATALCVKAGA